MPAYPFNPGYFTWNARERAGGSFRPSGRLVPHGLAMNPSLWDADEIVSARLIVGFNVGDTPTWSLDDLIGLVKKIRQRQASDPSASFVAQKGIYQHRDAAEGTVVEDGAQVFIINTSAVSDKEFTAQIVELAEELCREMSQESIVVEIQKNGISQKTMGIGP